MWHLLFWGSIAVIAYAYFGYPAVLYLIVKLRRPSPPVVDGTPGQFPRVCLIVSAYNEQAVIRRKIENSLALHYPADRLTILVASDGSTDDTVAIAGEYDRVEVRHFDRRRGKSAVLNDVVQSIDHDIVVFTDANAEFAPDAVERMTARFGDPGVGCVVGKLRYVERGSTSVGRGENVYWKYEALNSRLESELRSVLVANGSIFAIRRSLFRELYPDVANDFQIPTDVAAQGSGVVYEPGAVAEEHTTVFWREEFDRKVRIVLRGLTGFARLRGRIRGLRLWQFCSHKLLRWLVGFLLPVVLGANVVLAGDSFFYTLTLAAQVVFYFAAFNGWLARGAERPRRIFYIPFYFAMVNGSAAVAVVKFLFGRRQRVWDKAESTRLADVSPEASDTGDPESAGEDVPAKVGKN